MVTVSNDVLVKETPVNLISTSVALKPAVVSEINTYASLPNWNAATSPAADAPVSIDAATAVRRCAKVLSAMLKVAIPAAEIAALPAVAVASRVAIAMPANWIMSDAVPKSVIVSKFVDEGVLVAVFANTKVSVPPLPVNVSALTPPVIVSAAAPPRIVSAPAVPVSSALLAVAEPVMLATIIELDASTLIPPVFVEPLIVRVVPAVVLFASIVPIVTEPEPVIFRVDKSVAVN